MHFIPQILNDVMKTVPIKINKTFEVYCHKLYEPKYKAAGKDLENKCKIPLNRRIAKISGTEHYIKKEIKSAIILLAKDKTPGGDEEDEKCCIF